MCGLVGFSGKTNFNKDKIIQLMLWNSFLRGRDATGIYSPLNDLHKTTDEACEYLTKYKDDIKPDKLLIAHVRAATVGNKLSNKNAHPFNIGNTVLAHNGTLSNHYDLLRKHDLSFADYDVDSQIMCGIINKQQTFDVLKEIDGAAALLITNKDNPEILYAYRNSLRPLFKGNINGCMYISSIKESLDLIGCKNVKEFKEGYIYAIKDGLIISTTKVNNKPYIPNRNTVIPPLNRFIRTYLTLNTVPTYLWTDRIKNELSQYEAYLIEDVKNHEFVIKDNLGNRCEISSHNFFLENQAIIINSVVESMKDLISKNNNTDKIAKGDKLVIVEDYFQSGYVKAKHMVTGKSYVLSKEYLNRIGMFEKPETEQVPETSISFDITNFDNSLVDEHDDTIEEESDDNILDLEVNQQELLDDFNFIDTQCESLYNYGCKNLPDDKVNKFKDMYSKLDLHLVTCKEKYDVNVEL